MDMFSFLFCSGSAAAAAARMVFIIAVCTRKALDIRDGKYTFIDLPLTCHRLSGGAQAS